MMEPRKLPTRGHKKNVITSSSDSDDCKVVPEQSRRQSKRIYQKRHRKEFTLPSRDTIWDTISSSECPLLPIKKLTPRKTVNDFTKVYNTYNFDDYEDTSDSESLEVKSTDSDSDSVHGQQKIHRVKNYHKRIQVQQSSSDEESSLQTKDCKAIDVEKSTEKEESANNTCDDVNVDNTDSDEQIVMNKKKSLVLESDDDEDDDDDDDGDDDDDDDNNDDDNDDDVRHERSENEKGENSEASVSSSDENQPPCKTRSDRLNLERKRRRDSLFLELRKAQEKRKKS